LEGRQYPLPEGCGGERERCSPLDVPVRSRRQPIHDTARRREIAIRDEEFSQGDEVDLVCFVAVFERGNPFDIDAVDVAGEEIRLGQQGIGIGYQKRVLVVEN